ncbi:MAG TPA: hypothetical protein VFV72_13870 [Candidatus Limnocylindrales bacterium]|nr:hypothetical protein [Candidatus Limnocylindrales bacterium]
MTRNQFRALAAIAALVAVALVAMPALGVDPTRSPSTGTVPSAAPPSSEPSAQPKAAGSVEPSGGDEDGNHGNGQGQGNGNGNGKPDKAGKPDKDHAPEHPVTLTGVVKAASGDEGGYTLTVGSTVYELSAGPKWWWGDNNPLAKHVGKTVKIDGEKAEGSTEIDVLAIDGTAIRAAGKPPWAGGWKVVGPKHPGWAQWKIDKVHGQGLGKEGAPGQLKKDDAGTDTP